MAGLCSAPVLAQAQDQQSDPEIRQKELQDRKGELERSKKSETAIHAEIEVLSRERAELNADLVRTAGKIRDTETKMSATEQRLTDLGEDEADVRKKLDGSRAVVAELLAALQRMGRQPPPALLVQPEDALTSVRSAMLLGTVLPEIREQTEELAQDLAELNRVRNDISVERNRLTADRADLDASQARLKLLVDARQRRQEEREKALVEEQDRSQQLSREVKSLEDLIARMERDVATARDAAAAAAAAQPPVNPGRSDFAALNDPGRMSPAIAFSSARGMLPLPASGERIFGFGEDDEFGGQRKGVSILTRAAAQVTAPCDGWVVYAGPFRSYGQLLILNAGGGYHVLLAGMDKIDVSLGQFVLTGEPVAQMGENSKVASLVTANSAQPVLYVEFRKDGQSIDPSPWWASSTAEKVRG